MDRDTALSIQIGFFKDKLEKEGRLVIKVKGFSMWPFLSNASTVVIAPAGLKDVFVGDIVFAYADEQFICHRLFRKKEASFQTKADALAGLDPWMHETQLMGKVINTPWGGPVGFMIAWLTFFVGPFYPALRAVKRALIRNIKK